MILEFYCHANFDSRPDLSLSILPQLFLKCHLLYKGSRTVLTVLEVGKPVKGITYNLINAIDAFLENSYTYKI